MGESREATQRKELERPRERGSDDKNGAFELGFPDVEWEGQVGYSRCKVV